MGSLESKTTGSGERERLRVTFDSAAARTSRPGRTTRRRSTRRWSGRPASARGGTALEVGCATGKATLPLARRRAGHHLPGDRRRSWPPRPGATWRTSRPSRWCSTDFETWRPPRPRAFDLVFAATAWHWIDPAVGYRRAWELLRPGGHLAIWDQGTCSPTAATRSSARSSPCTTRSARACRPARSTRGRGSSPDQPGRDRGQRAVRATCSSRRFDWEIQLRRRRVPPAAGHVLRATSRWRRGSGSGSTARSAAAWPAPRRQAAPALGIGAARGAPPRRRRPGLGAGPG